MNSPVFTEIILIIYIRFLNTISLLFLSILETCLLNDYDVLFNISFIPSLLWVHIHCPHSKIVNGRKFQAKRISTQPKVNFVIK